jgi:type VI secretion system protein ImpM
MSAHSVPGLFGKLPWEGDFIQRGLPGRFVRPWDAWLSGALAASRNSLSDAWADAYLLSPPWRFLIEPGVIDTSGWTGVLVSSIDRVRRYFPLTLALELPAGEPDFPQAFELGPLLDMLEAAALGLIATQQPVETMLTQTGRQTEATMAAIAAARPRSFALQTGRAGPARLMIGAAGGTTPLLALDERDSGTSGCSSWWHDRWSQHAPVAIRCQGLPAPEIFAGFLDGDWQRHGWRAKDGGPQP